MPNRIIRDGVLDSEKIDRLNAEEERFFYRLCLVVDDFGKIRANASLIKSKCFPLKDKISADQIEKWLESLSKELVVIYEVEDKRYLKIIDFKQRLRVMKSECPDPVGQMSDTCQSNDRQSHALFDSYSNSDSIQKEDEPKTEYENAFEAYLEMRKTIKKPATDHAKKLIGKKLDELSCGDVKKKIAILNQSIVNSWQGVFPLNQNKFQTNKLNRQPVHLTMEQMGGRF